METRAATTTLQTSRCARSASSKLLGNKCSYWYQLEGFVQGLLPRPYGVFPFRISEIICTGDFFPLELSGGTWHWYANFASFFFIFSRATKRRFQTGEFPDLDLSFLFLSFFGLCGTFPIFLGFPRFARGWSGDFPDLSFASFSAY